MNEPRGLLSTHIHSDGGKSDLIIVPGGIGKKQYRTKPSIKRIFYSYVWQCYV